jgi:hypothetical protein
MNNPLYHQKPEFPRTLSVFLLSAIICIMLGMASSAAETAAPSPVTISARFINGGTDPAPCVQAGISPIPLEITVAAAAPIKKDAQWVVRGREIFSGKQLEGRLKLAQPIAAGGATIPLTLTPAELKLTPGSWILLVDLESGGKSLAGTEVGCVEVYVKRQEESPEHILASFSLARVDFAYDEQYQIYYSSYQPALPPTGDPYDKRDEARLFKDYIVGKDMPLELMHDGGMGFLYAAVVYDALGEKERRAFCDKVLRRTADAITHVMYDGKGKVYSVGDPEQLRKQGWYSWNQEGFALTFLCQTYFYFRLGPGRDPDYARSILKTAGEIYDHQLSQPLQPGCGFDVYPCNVYDGRILSGICWYCLAYQAENQVFPDSARKVNAAVRTFIQHMISHQGWYDDGCLLEHDCHIWYGNLNLLNGLLPARRMNAGRDAVEYLDRGVKEAFRFLTQTNGYITGEPAFAPEQVASWASGDVYAMCDDYLQQLGPDPGVERLQRYLNLSNIGVGEAFHRNNCYGGALLRCSEYLALEKKPPLPWLPDRKSIEAANQRPMHRPH